MENGRFNYNISMSGDLLQTKLHVPRLRPSLIPRPHLIQKLNTGLNGKLILISAPAGFGKTTLIAEWTTVLSRGMRSAESTTPHSALRTPHLCWLALDESDNDSTRFLTYFIAALNRIEGVKAAIGEGALLMLQSPQPTPVTAVLTTLINEIAAFPDSITLVLDDYHLIESQSIHDALTFLLEHLPPQMHLVIATRDDPHLPLARLRARGQLTELRAADLRFSSSEAAEFLNQVMGLDLAREDIAALESRTEGWIAGLQLAALSIQGRQDAANLIQSFTGSHRFVLDYLIEEVLEQQSESVQTFLLQTAVLKQLTGPLCNALTSQDNGQEILEKLEHANLFIIPLDEERRWYRYHHLFADLLAHRQRQNQPEQIPKLHSRASKWFEQNGFIAEAIEHALQAKDFERAAHLIEEHIDALWGQSQNRKLRRWLDALPQALLFSRPYTTVYQARYQINSGQLEAAKQTLNAVEQALVPIPGHASETESQKRKSITNFDRVKLRGRVAATRALICSYQGDVPGIIQHASQALEILPREDLTWRSVTALTLGNAHGFRGDMKAAYEARFEALKACEAAGNIYFVMVANLELAITLREQGRLERTIEICRQQMQLANQSGLSQTRIVGWLLAVWGETLAELNDLNGAIDRTKKGFELTERSGDMQMLGWSFMCLIRTLFSRGDLADAEETIQKMENFARESHIPPWIANQMAAWQARLWLTQDRLEAASQWVEDRRLDTGGESIPHQEIDFFSLFDYLILARTLIAQERPDEASRLLQHLFEDAEAGGRTSKMIEILILQALALQVGGETNAAITKLERALSLAEPGGFVRIFVDEGPPMARLLYEALSLRIAPGYVRRLLAAFPVSEPEQSPSPKPDDTEFEWVESLSEREIEVLQLIAQGLTNQEIASRLFLALNTVKSHTRNIYSKLGVNSRVQAVARARDMGVLPPINARHPHQN